MNSDDEDLDCPLCMEEFDIADRNFRPCPCGYQICRFCWHHIKTNLNGRCPACRRTYTDQIAEFIPVSAEEILRSKREKKERERQNREMKDPTRRQLSNVRVVQKNLVYVLGLPSKYASAEHEFFKKYGKVLKLVMSKRTTAPSTNHPNATTSVGIYVTYARKEDAAKAIAGINGAVCGGRVLRASYGTTKYCTYYLRHMACPNPNCMYLHEPGDDVDSYNKENPTLEKHAAASSIGPTYPNKRIATASKSTVSGTAPIDSSSAVLSTANATAATTVTTTTATTAVTHVPAEPPKVSPWAPLPKIVPPPPAPILESEKPSYSPTDHHSATAKAVVPKVSASTKVSSLTGKTSKATPKKAAPVMSKSMSETLSSVKSEESGRPALPATASWAKAPKPSPSDSVITPANFGPSLSDALSAPAKPKHASVLPRKKEKKLKSKMVRLEEFEEAEKESHLPLTGWGSKEKARKIADPGKDVLSDKSNLQMAGPESQDKLHQQKSGQAKATETKPASQDTVEPALPEMVETSKLPTIEPAIVSQHADSRKSKEQGAATMTDTDLEGTMMESADDAIDTHASETVIPARDNAELDSAETAQDDKLDVSQVAEAIEATDALGHPEADAPIIDEYQARHKPTSKLADNMGETVVVEHPDQTSELKPATTSSLNESLSIQFEWNDSAMEHALEKEGADEDELDLDLHDLSAMNDEIVKAFDFAQAAENEPLDQGPQLYDLDLDEKMQNDVDNVSGLLSQQLSMPLVEMERLSALVKKDFLQESPSEFSEQSPPPPGFMNDRPEQLDRSRFVSTAPPPGLDPPPPEWMTRGFDPFNGQDPSLIASRRLQHSQQMLEASGLFHGFGQPMPRFGLNPNFHPNGTPPPPFAGQMHPPPPLMFPPTPHHHHHHHPHPPPHPPHPLPHGMLRPPAHDFGVLPSPPPPPPPPPSQSVLSPNTTIDHLADVADLHKEFNHLSINSQLQMQSPNPGPLHMGEDARRSIRDDFRALLPNVTISFGPDATSPNDTSCESVNRNVDPFFQQMPPSIHRESPIYSRQSIPPDHDVFRRDSSAVNSTGSSEPSMNNEFDLRNPMRMQDKELQTGIYRDIPARPDGLKHDMMDSSRTGTGLNGPANSFSPVDDHRRPSGSPEMFRRGPPGIDMFAEPSVNAYGGLNPAARSSERPTNETDVRKEAQNFFGEFLKKAASASQESSAEKAPTEKNTSLPFQDPAIMSVRLSGAEQCDSAADRRASATTMSKEPQNSILQILGGPPHSMHSTPPHHHPQMSQRPLQHHPQREPPFSSMNDVHISPPSHFGQQDRHLNSHPMFMSGPPLPSNSFQQPQHHLHQPNPAQYHPNAHFPPQGGPVPGLPPHFMSGMNMVGRMPPMAGGPRPLHPGMLPSMPMSLPGDMMYRQRPPMENNNNLPPGLFFGGGMNANDNRQ